MPLLPLGAPLLGIARWSDASVVHVIWAKQSLVMVGRGHYHWQHEPCWYAVRGTGHWLGGRKQSTLWQIATHGQDPSDDTRHTKTDRLHEASD